MQPWIYFLILGILALSVIILAARTALLRDVIQDDNAFHANALTMNLTNPKAPYSLARTQLALWTVIISSSFLYALFDHDFEIPSLNNVNLILLGISVATTASGKLIDDSQKQNPDLSQNYPSESFLLDILSDKAGVSIHRLQNVVWTVIVAIIYIQYVFVNRNLPDETTITENLLILMGISTTAYIGLKTQENATKPGPNPPAGGNPNGGVANGGNPNGGL